MKTQCWLLLRNRGEVSEKRLKGMAVCMCGNACMCFLRNSAAQMQTLYPELWLSRSSKFPSLLSVDEMGSLKDSMCRSGGMELVCLE